MKNNERYEKLSWTSGFYFHRIWSSKQKGPHMMDDMIKCIKHHAQTRTINKWRSTPEQLARYVLLYSANSTVKLHEFSKKAKFAENIFVFVLNKSNWSNRQRKSRADWYKMEIR